MNPYFDDGTVSLYLGNAFEVLPALGITADLVLTDPPYNETSLEWDRWPDGWPSLAASATSSMWCFGSLRMFMDHAAEFSAAGWRMSHDVVGKDDIEIAWEKHNASGPNSDRFRRIHEQAALFYRGPWDDVYRDPQRTATGVVERGRVVTQGPKEIGHRGKYRTGAWTDSGTRLLTSVLQARSLHRRGGIHPCQKPIELLMPLIRYACPPGGLVLDLFAGSGSTLDTARQCGRRAIGIEGFEPYAESAAKRLSQPVLDFEGLAS